MIMLGVETSCDETSVALVSSSRTVLSNVVASQIETHRLYGGVVPEIAARSHLSNIQGVFNAAMFKSGIKMSDITAVAATCGPGLIGGVIVGSSFAKGLALSLNVPFIPINHLMAHMLTPRLTNDLEYPFLVLLASGGHSLIAEIHSPSSTTILGRTIDDSAGECFDKVAKMMNIPYPGGPEIEKLAKFGDNTRFQFPIPLRVSSGCNFSFSGLKTAVLYKIKEIGQLDDQTVKDLCASFQTAVVNVLKDKLKKAVKIANKEILSVAFCGGVSANEYISDELANLCNLNNLQFFKAPTYLCTDNAAMISWCGIEQFSNETKLDFEPNPSWFI